MFSFFFFSSLDPMRGPRKLEVVEVKSRQITIRWEPFGYNVTRCHSYNLTVHYCYKVGGQEQVREEVSWDTENSHPQHTITNLSPYTNVSVKLILMNPEGRKESQELVVQTDEDREYFEVMCLCETCSFSKMQLMFLTEIFTMKMEENCLPCWVTCVCAASAETLIKKGEDNKDTEACFNFYVT